MKVPDGLAGLGAVVDDEAEIGQPLFLGDLARDPVEMAHQFFVTGGHAGEPFKVFEGADQDVRRGLGVQVPEGETLRVLMDQFGRDLFFADLTEEAIHTSFLLRGRYRSPPEPPI